MRSKRLVFTFWGEWRERGWDVCPPIPHTPITYISLISLRERKIINHTHSQTHPQIICRHAYINTKNHVIGYPAHKYRTHQQKRIFHTHRQQRTKKEMAMKNEEELFHGRAGPNVPRNVLIVTLWGLGGPRDKLWTWASTDRNRRSCLISGPGQLLNMEQPRAEPHPRQSAGK